MSYERHRQLREVAILVTSLDDRWTERLLGSLPSKDAAAVWEAVEHLGPVDPEEQQEIIEKFRRSTEDKSPTKVDGVELDASLLARFEEQSLDESYSQPSVRRSPLNALSEDEEQTLVHALSGEHPQTIAVVLSRLGPAKASKLLTKLSPSIQADVLARMADCDSADEQTIHVVESQLALWINQQRQKKQRMAAGIELVQQILKSTPESQRDVILTQLGNRNPSLAGRLTSRQEAPAETGNLALCRHTDNNSSDDAKKDIPSLREQTFQVVPQRMEQPTAASDSTISTDPLRELEQLDNATLAAALSQSDRQVATLALAGAGDSLMMRILCGLPRRQANKFRQQLRNIGPTRLSDMFSAQQQLLQIANQIASSRKGQQP